LSHNLSPNSIDKNVEIDRSDIMVGVQIPVPPLRQVINTTNDIYGIFCGIFCGVIGKPLSEKKRKKSFKASNMLKGKIDHSTLWSGYHLLINELLLWRKTLSMKGRKRLRLLNPLAWLHLTLLQEPRRYISLFHFQLQSDLTSRECYASFWLKTHKPGFF